MNLALEGNQISDIAQFGTTLTKMKRLTDLKIYDNEIQDIAFLAELTQLTHLALSKNQIRDITLLAGLTNLKYLYLSDNQIANISTIENFKSFKKFYILRTTQFRICRRFADFVKRIRVCGWILKLIANQNIGKEFR